MKVRIFSMGLLLAILLTSVLMPYTAAQEPVAPKNVPASEGKAPAEAGGTQGCGIEALWPGPDGFGYVGEAIPYDWVDISGSGTAVYLNCDDCYDGPFGIGFTFPFYGTDWTDFYVGSNGQISFGQGRTTYTNVCPLPGGTNPNIIVPLWDDLWPGNNNAPIYYETFATCPYGGGSCLVIAYHDYYLLSGVFAGTWEAILYPSGEILFQFFEVGPDPGGSSTTGIEGIDFWQHGLTYDCNNVGYLGGGLALRIWPGPPPSPDLSDSYKEAPPEVLVGDPFTYTIVIDNSGIAPLQSPVMTDVIPAGTTYIPGSLSCSRDICWDDGTAVYWRAEEERWVVYGAAHLGPDGPSLLLAIDPATGSAIPIGPIGFERVSGMDFDPLSGVLYATGERADGSDELVLLTIDTITGAGTEVGVIGDHSFGDTIADISFRSDGALYAYLEAGDGLGTLDPATGALTELGPTNTASCCGNGIAFSPGDTLYHATDDPLNTLDQTTGQATFVTNLIFSPPADNYPRINAMDYDPGTGILYGSLNDAYGWSGLPENYLATVDTGTGVVTIIGPTFDGLDAIALGWWTDTRLYPGEAVAITFGVTCTTSGLVTNTAIIVDPILTETVELEAVTEQTLGLSYIYLPIVVRDQ